jgi:hypothetical protein
MFGDKSTPVPICLWRTPYAQSWDWFLVSWMRIQRLTTVSYQWDKQNGHYASQHSTAQYSIALVSEGLPISDDVVFTRTLIVLVKREERRVQRSRGGRVFQPHARCVILPSGWVSKSSWQHTATFLGVGWEHTQLMNAQHGHTVATVGFAELQKHELYSGFIEHTISTTTITTTTTTTTIV